MVIHQSRTRIGFYCCEFQASQWLKGFKKGSRQKSKRAGDNTLSQIHHNDTLRKGKAIALNSAEIKIVRTRAQTLHWRVAH